MSSRKVWRFFQSLYGRLGFNNVSIQNRLVVNSIVLIIIPLVLYFFILNIYTVNTRAKEMQMIRQLSSQAVESIDLYLGDVSSLTMQPLYNRDIINILIKINDDYAAFANQRKHNFYELGDAAESSGHQAVTDEEDNEMTYLVNSLRVYKKYIHSVFIFDRNGNSLYYSLCSGQLAQPYDPTGETWYKLCTKSSGSLSISGVTKIPNILPKSRESESFVFPAARVIKDVDRPGILGYICIFSNVDILRSECSRIKSVSGEEILILDNSGSIVYDTEEGNIGRNISGTLPGLSLKDMALSPDGALFEEGGKRFLATSDAIKASGWKLVRLIPEDSLYVNDRNVRQRLILIVAVFTVLTLIMTSFISYGITKPLKKLNRTMKVVENGDLTVRFNVKYNDEIGKLGLGFNSMIGEIEKLINDVYMTETRKKEAELNALQAQINPHFIYNTLESIRMMAYLNKDMETAHMVSVLGSLLRYGISAKNQLTTVGDEIEHLNNYMILQNHRFDNKFTLTADIPAELHDVKIIRLVFQPIVENAIYHALDTVSGTGSIRISAVLSEDMVSFIIEDNGVGMSEEQLGDLVLHINDPAPAPGRSRGVGLRNVNERIKLYYGEKYGMTITSEVGRGTAVRLDFPGVRAMNEFKFGGQSAERT